MGGRIVARGQDEPHRCKPRGDRTRTFELPPTPPPPSGARPTEPAEPLVHRETYARPGDVYECDCGLTWVARVSTVSHEWIGSASDWRREHWWERRRRLSRSEG